MIEPPGYPEEWDWLEIVANIGYGISVFSLLIFTIGILVRKVLLSDMFYVLRLNFGICYLMGLCSMWVADLTVDTVILTDRHNNIAISALQQYWYQAAALCLFCDSTAMFRAVTGGVIGGKTKAYLPIAYGLPLLNLGKIYIV